MCTDIHILSDYEEAVYFRASEQARRSGLSKWHTQWSWSYHTDIKIMFKSYHMSFMIWLVPLDYTHYGYLKDCDLIRLDNPAHPGLKNQVVGYCSEHL